MRGPRIGVIALFAIAGFFFTMIFLSLARDERYQPQSASASITPSIAPSSTSSPTWTSSPVPTVDALATTSAQGEATSSAANTAIATTQTAIAFSTDEALRAEALAALAREREDAHAIALAQIAELDAKKRLVELTLNPTAVTISQTEEARQLWRKIERDRVEDEAHAALVAQKLEDEKNVSRSQSVGMITLYAGVPIAIVISIVMLAHAQSQKIRATRDAALAEIEARNYERASKNYEAELEHDLQMRRAEILNRRDLINVVSKRSVSTIDGRMTRERLLAFVKAAVLASGPASSVLTPSTDRVWTDDDVRISHREYSACAEELHRLQWIEKPERGKLTKLTEGATLGDLLSVLQRSNPDDASETAPPPEIQEEPITQS